MSIIQEKEMTKTVFFLDVHRSILMNFVSKRVRNVCHEVLSNDREYSIAIFTFEQKVDSRSANA